MYLTLVPCFLTDRAENEHLNRSFCCIIDPISDIIDHYCIMEKVKTKSRKNENKLRTIFSKNYENFKNSDPRVQFYWFLLVH